MSTRRILLVDDSETILQIEQMILSKLNYDLVTAHDGDEGVAKALASHPDLILMDVIMPKMGGFEAVRQLRELDQTKTVPIMMVTTEAEAESMEKGYLTGCNDYIVKPIDTNELVAKVKNLLGE
jgi:DNA-binding response OmpR family regulator